MVFRVLAYSNTLKTISAGEEELDLDLDGLVRRGEVAWLDDDTDQPASPASDPAPWPGPGELSACCVNFSASPCLTYAHVLDLDIGRNLAVSKGGHQGVQACAMFAIHSHNYILSVTSMNNSCWTFLQSRVAWQGVQSPAGSARRRRGAAATAAAGGMGMGPPQRQNRRAAAHRPTSGGPPGAPRLCG